MSVLQKLKNRRREKQLSSNAITTTVLSKTGNTGKVETTETILNISQHSVLQEKRLMSLNFQMAIFTVLGNSQDLESSLLLLGL